MAKDAQLLADALEAGAPDPGTPNSAAAEEAIVNAQRRAEAARLVAQRRLVDLEVVLAGPAAEEWIASLVTEQAVAFEA